MGHVLALGSFTAYSSSSCNPLVSSNPVLTVESSLGPLGPEITWAPLLLVIFVAQLKQLQLLSCLGDSGQAMTHQVPHHHHKAG